MQDEPFKAFRVRLSNGSTIDVLDQHSVVVGPTSAIIPMEYVEEDGFRLVRRWKTLALNHMVEFIDLDIKNNGKRRRK